MSNRTPHHRHQGSLEGVIVFDTTHHLSAEQRVQAARIFNTVIEACEPLQQRDSPYKKITLVRLTYEYARSEASKDNFLHFFFQCTEIPDQVSDWEEFSGSDYAHQLNAFADTLFENFFLPCKMIRILLMCQVF